MSFSINGLASGLDTAQIIKDMMSIERIPYTNLESKKKNLQTEQAIFRQLNTKLSTLQRLASDMQLKSAFDTNKGVLSNSNVGTVAMNGNAATGSYNIKVIELAVNKITAAEGINGSSTDITAGIFTIGTGANAKTINVDTLAPADGGFSSNEDALKALVKEINRGDYGGRAALIDVTGSGDFRLSITGSEGGDADIDFTLGSHASTVVQGHSEAELEIDGVTIKRSSNTINDLIPGVTLSLQARGESTLKIDRNVDAITNQVESFVTAYNDLMKQVKTNLAKPEGKDAVNPLQSDTTLKAIQNELYNMITSVVKDGSMVGFMEELGLSIDKGVKSASEFTGQIKFDKETFKKALTENPEKVTTIFVDRMTDMSKKLFDQYTSSTKGIINMKVTGYDSEIKVVDDRLSSMERTLEMKETRLKMQFNSMEVMLSSLKNQQDWLGSQFESLMNSTKR
jgi:flagellar hook-associated protein 2